MSAPASVVDRPARRRIIPPLLVDNRAFRRLWIGQSISLVGDQISLIALPLVAVLALDASAAQMGYLAAAGLAPNLLFSMYAGALVDRHGHRRLFMIAADLGRAALVFTIPAAYLLGVLSLGLLYVVAFAAGTLSVLFSVSYSTLFVSVVPRERYVDGMSLLNGTRAMSFVGGPSIGGILVQVLSAPITLIADGLSYLASALFLRRISAVEPPVEPRGRGHVIAGAQFIAGSPIVLRCMLSSATINFFNFIFWALLVLYATTELHVPPGALGLVLGAAAFGGVLGSLVAGRIGRRIGIGPTYLLGCVLFTSPLVLVPLAGGPQPQVLAMLFSAEFISGFGVMLLDISVSALFAAIIPDRLRARVAGAHMLVNYGIRPLGSLAGGALGATLGLRPALWIGAVGAIAGVLWALWSPVRGVRELPDAAE